MGADAYIYIYVPNWDKQERKFVFWTAIDEWTNQIHLKIMTLKLSVIINKQSHSIHI